MPNSLFGNHLLGGVDVESAAHAALTFGRLQARLSLRDGLGVSASADESRSMTETESFRSVTFAVASLAVDVLIRAVAG